MLFQYLLKTLVTQGTIHLTTVDGRTMEIGSGNPRIALTLHRKDLEWTLGLNPELKIGEAYTDGTLTIDGGTLADFFQILFINDANIARHPVYRVFNFLRGQTALWRQINPLGRARKNVAAHYDLPDELYELFLDPDRQYSCAYFTNVHNSLSRAQLDKKRHIAAKLMLDKPGLRVLDIGSGWGGMCLYLAREYGCKTTGVTLSKNQYKYSRLRVREAKMKTDCNFKLIDYRLEQGTYDRIVSVGMFEHVGRKNYDEFFANIRERLADNGVCVLHTISHFGPPRRVNAFIHKHIFPGADIPAMSEILEPIQRSGLFVTDIEILRLHYAETLKHWAQRFESNKDKIILLYGEPFYRKWMFYLVGCEMAFRNGDLMVAQVQLTKQLATIPLTRDYIYQEEHQQRWVTLKAS